MKSNLHNHCSTLIDAQDLGIRAGIFLHSLNKEMTIKELYQAADDFLAAIPANLDHKSLAFFHSGIVCGYGERQNGLA